ncbi:MAG: hypothetical protein WC797_04430, partial [Candidatus Paceibacterota bacterium]
MSGRKKEAVLKEVDVFSVPEDRGQMAVLESLALTRLIKLNEEAFRNVPGFFKWLLKNSIAAEAAYKDGLMEVVRAFELYQEEAAGDIVGEPEECPSDLDVGVREISDNDMSHFQTKGGTVFCDEVISDGTSGAQWVSQ